MAPVAHWPVPVATVGPSTAGVALFRHAGQLHVTCVVKATFAFVPDAAMTSVPPEELFRAEAHHRDNPARSVRATSDVVPYLPRVDIVLTGHACAPAGQTVTRQAVRLAVFRDQALLDKTLHVYGDRGGPEIKPFDRMPIVYERALGGIGFRPNPYGTGKAPGSASPNIVYPSDGGVVAGFGPVSRALGPRRALLGSLPAAGLDQAVPELPAGFDWAYFQAAPPDQQIPSLVGNEWIVLEGLHPEHPRLASRLPTVRGLATLFGLDPDRPEAARSIALRPDLLRIDADTLRCSLVCRAIVALPDERALTTLRVAAGIETQAGAPLCREAELRARGSGGPDPGRALVPCARGVGPEARGGGGDAVDIECEPRSGSPAATPRVSSALRASAERRADALRAPSRRPRAPGQTQGLGRAAAGADEHAPEAPAAEDPGEAAGQQGALWWVRAAQEEGLIHDPRARRRASLVGRHAVDRAPRRACSSRRHHACRRRA
jgi:hypothetical protein